MMKRGLFFVLVVGLLTFVFIGCDGFFTKPVDHPDISTRDNSWLDDYVLSHREQVALVYGREDYKKSFEDLQAYVQNFLDNHKATDMQINNRATEIITKSFERGFVTDKSEDRSSSINLYVFILENAKDPKKGPGYILACDDIRVGHIQAFVQKGNFSNPNNRFLNMVKEKLDLYMQDTIDVFNSITEADIQAVQAKVGQWNQSNSRASFGDDYNWGAIIPYPLTESFYAYRPGIDVTL